MKQINNSRTELIWMENFEKNWQIQIRNFMTTRSRMINVAVKEDVITDTQHADSNNLPSNKMISYAISLDFTTTSVEVSDNSAYRFTNNDSSFSIDENKYEQSVLNDHSSGFTGTLKNLNSKSGVMFHSGKQNQTENELFSNESESNLMVCKDCEDSQNSSYEFIKFFVPPKMPTELLTSLSQPRFLNAARRERMLYCVQRNLYLDAKTIFGTLFKMHKIKISDFHILSKIHFVISKTLYGILSRSLNSSLNLSHLRRKNVRSLLKDETVNIFNNSIPTIGSLFGCAVIYPDKSRNLSHKKITTDNLK